MLRTKEMRERDHRREMRRYRFVLIRVRFPNGVLLQGTFWATDKAATLVEFVRSCLQNDWMPFVLSSQTGHKLEEDAVDTLAELGLAPAAIVNFAWEAAIQREIVAQSSIEETIYLKDELMVDIKTL